jgi:hypothetical protein
MGVQRRFKGEALIPLPSYDRPGRLWPLVELRP